MHATGIDLSERLLDYGAHIKRLVDSLTNDLIRITFVFCHIDLGE